MPLNSFHAEPPLEVAEPVSEGHRRYWRNTRWLSLGLLLVWFFVTFVLGYFARDLSFSFFGWPFSFWVAAQGALVVYVLIVWCHAWAMERLDRRHRSAD